MSTVVAFILASFTVPENIGTSAQAMFWLLPVVAAIAIIYKTTKLPTITPGSFIKEVVILFGSIVVFIVITAVVLHALAWLITE